MYIANCAHQKTHEAIMLQPLKKKIKTKNGKKNKET